MKIPEALDLIADETRPVEVDSVLRELKKARLVLAKIDMRLNVKTLPDRAPESSGATRNVSDTLPNGTGTTT